LTISAEGERLRQFVVEISGGNVCAVAQHEYEADCNHAAIMF